MDRLLFSSLKQGGLVIVIRYKQLKTLFRLRRIFTCTYMGIPASGETSRNKKVWSWMLRLNVFVFPSRSSGDMRWNLFPGADKGRRSTPARHELDWIDFLLELLASERSEIFDEIALNWCFFVFFRVFLIVCLFFFFFFHLREVCFLSSKGRRVIGPCGN